MKYRIEYCCVSHIGNCRSNNQDNFLCNKQYMESENKGTSSPLNGAILSTESHLFCVYDGMGGEESGEMAAYLAAMTSKEAEINNADPCQSMVALCRIINRNICDYADEHLINSMGTTAAMLLFRNKNVYLCNIGDSKIFHISSCKMTQISKDHVAISAFGTKPPLSQNLGIPEDELIIEPYVAHGKCSNKDMYLLCSDGLTDMLTETEIKDIVLNKPLKESADLLLSLALEHGGRDNITFIICKIHRISWFDTIINKRKKN